MDRLCLFWGFFNYKYFFENFGKFFSWDLSLSASSARAARDFAVPCFLPFFSSPLDPHNVAHTPSCLPLLLTSTPHGDLKLLILARGCTYFLQGDSLLTWVLSRFLASSWAKASKVLLQGGSFNLFPLNLAKSQFLYKIPYFFSPILLLGWTS